MKAFHETTKNHIMYSRRTLSSNVLHWHESIEFCRSNTDGAKFVIDNIVYNFNKGDIVIVPSKCIHKVICTNQNTFDIFLIPTHDFMPVIRHYPAIPIYIPYNDIKSREGLSEQIDDLFDKIYNTYPLNIPYSQTLSLAYALSLTSLVLMSFPPKKAQNDKNRKCIQPVLDEITANCTNPKYSLTYFSKKLNYSPEYFSTMFKTVMGIGFKDYIDRQRIEEAKRLLLINYSSISNIAERCGFANIRTFNNRFKALENITPSEFINKYISEEKESFDCII